MREWKRSQAATEYGIILAGMCAVFIFVVSPKLGFGVATVLGAIYVHSRARVS